MSQNFIGFTYNGKHSDYFEIYRTSDGDRYNDNLVPIMTDKTVDIPGSDGQFYFSTTHKNRQFSISIAFEHLTEAKYREMRSWLDGKGIHDLIFDEAPYKVYSAKVTGTPQLKIICFDEKNESGIIERIYKGEGTIQFTCYYPYAHTPKSATMDGRILDNYTDDNKNEWAEASELPTSDEFVIGMNKGDLPTPFILTKNGAVNMGDKFVVGTLAITISQNCSDIKWDSKTGMVIGKLTGSSEETLIPYTGRSYGFIPKDGLTQNNIYYFCKEGSSYYRILSNRQKIQYNETNTTAVPGTTTRVTTLPYTIDYQFWYY